MMCYKDTNFCYDANYCVNAEFCHKRCTTKDRDVAYIVGLPVYMTSFKDTCPFWKNRELHEVAS